jgi:CheY-like chemotaxis protein
LYIPAKKQEEPAAPKVVKQDLEMETREAQQPIRPNAEPAAAEDIPQEVADDRDNISANDKVILVVEDDTAFAKALVHFAHDQGYKAIVAMRGDQGVAFAKKYKPLGILLDIQLPVKDGWQVMNELKQDIATRHIPVHMMSAIEAKKESLSKGAVDFINKPVAYEQMPDVFRKLEQVLENKAKKVLIIEENRKHAEALSFFLGNHKVSSEITSTISEGADALRKKEINCVILDMGVSGQKGYETLEGIKNNPAFENVPIIMFTGKHLSQAEEERIRKYADSIVVKTAHSYKRMLDEVALFLHLVEENLEKQSGRSSGRQHALEQVLENKTVLIVDDDVRNIFSLAKALEGHKMKVLSATNGKEALKALEENPNVDVVLMDMMMPEMDGYQATAHIRTRPVFRKLPVIAVTAKAMTGDREKCIKAGASDYISKPVDIDQLLSLLRVWLYRR